MDLRRESRASKQSRCPKECGSEQWATLAEKALRKERQSGQHGSRLCWGVDYALRTRAWRSTASLMARLAKGSQLRRVEQLDAREASDAPIVACCA